MKKIIFVLLVVVTSFNLSAEPHQRGITSEEILDLFPGIGEKTFSELTISERIAISEEISIDMQEKNYVRRAAFASFLIPGAGQFMTGDPLTGAAHLAGEAAIVGGVITGLYFLLPEDLKDGSLTREERHDLYKTYMTPDNIDQILPAMGVMAGGALLSVFNSIIASHDAAENAFENIESGSVTFNPYLNTGSTLGMGLRMNW